MPREYLLRPSCIHAGLCAALIVLPVGSQAACSTWDVGRLAFDQGNSIGVVLTLTRKGDDLNGRAVQHFVKPASTPLEKLGMVGRDPGQASGSVDGVIKGNRLEFTVRWDNASTGVYRAVIDEHGRLTGETYDFHKPSSRAAIMGFDRVRCADAASAPAAADKPVRQLGKRSAAVSDTTVAKLEPGEARCTSGYVWREARPDDRVCVTPQSRARVAAENARAATHWTEGAYGPKTCSAGLVWREAFAGDMVCVTPAARDAAREENRLADSRVAR